MNSSPKEAFLELIEANRNLIYKVCLMFQTDTENIADCYQDIVLNLWQAYPSFKGDSKASTWIYRIALNTCVSELRKQQSRPEMVPITCDMAELMGNDEGYMEQIKELYRLISRLNKLERAIILLWLDDKSYEEIAAVMGMSKTNVGVRLLRIKEKLKDMNGQN